MTRVVQARNDALAVVRDTGDHCAYRRLAICIHYCERIAKVAEYLREETTSVGDDQGDIVGPSNLRNTELLSKRHLGQHHNLELLDIRFAQWPGIVTGRHIVI